MTRRAAILLMLACLSAQAAGQPGSATASGEGIVVMLVRETGVPPHRQFVFSIQRSGLPETAKPFTIANETVSIETVEIHPGPIIAVIGKTLASVQTLTIIDPTSGTARFERVCAQLRLTLDRKVFQCTDAAGRMVSYLLATGEVRDSMPPVAGAVHILTSGSMPARIGLLRALPRSPQLSGSPVVRSALSAALQREVARDMELAAAPPDATNTRLRSAQRDYLGMLIATITPFADSANLAPLCRADHLGAVGARTVYGVHAIPVVAEALRERQPSGYSSYYRAGLLESLMLILQRSRDVTDVDRSTIVALTRSSLEHPTSWRELARAIDLAGELDEGQLDGHLEALASNADAVSSRGIVSPDQIQRIQEKAQAVLNRRVVLP